MKKRFPILLASCLLLMVTSSCDDNTGTLGIRSDADGISNSMQVFQISSRSLAMDSVLANSTKSFLGQVIDPETGAEIQADFAAQFYTFENYEFPNRDMMVGDKDGRETRGVVQCDSCEVRLYFDSYQGDSNNPMKIEVFELSSSHLLSEDSVYYSDVDLSQFLPADARPLASRVFTPRDYNQSSTTLSSSAYNANVSIRLPAALGQRIMNSYYEKPSRFASSYNFIREVLPGLYFRTSGGQGTMLSVYVGTFNIYYRYADEIEDTIYGGLTRFAATPEVIQSTHFRNSDISPLLSDQSCTYLKTPAGLCTELTLPIDQLFCGEHSNDSISLASITLTRYNKPQTGYQLSIPGELLMVRKSEANDFFAKHQVSNGRTSFTTTFNSTYNTYTFDNIGRLLTYCQNEHRKMQQDHAAGKLSNEAWEHYLENWNKVLLIPVITSSTTRDGYTVQVSVNHDLSLSNIRLVGGTNTIPMQVVYSKFYQE
ncbi:MAG: DUF4270 domain-containing protein [Bacteroidaceae bacterium]|nr:DUF4270 domain-containing protein [Bacteroidaceae bacterium]